MLKRLNRVAGFWLVAPPFKFLERKIQMIKCIWQCKDILKGEIDIRQNVELEYIQFFYHSKYGKIWL